MGAKRRDNRNKKHILIACGGTGGHLFPGIAVGELLARDRHEVTLLISEKKIDTLAASGQPNLKFEKMADFTPAYEARLADHIARFAMGGIAAIAPAGSRKTRRAK